MIPVVIKNHFHKSLYLTVAQVRVSSGDETIEFPSGGVDVTLTLEENALRELEEETGIKGVPSRLVCLRSNVTVCESAFDESVTWYLLPLHEKEVEAGVYGDESSGEVTRTRLCCWSDLVKVNTFHMIAARMMLSDYFLGLGSTHTVKDRSSFTH